MATKINDLILTAGPYINERELEYGLDAIKNGWNHHHSDYIAKFENAMAQYCGTKFALATSSCTGAMHLTLVAMGITYGDEVIVPETTWVATATAVCYTGAKPIFCDVDKKTWTMCPKSLESKITSKTKAIMPVHIYGHPCDMDPIMAIAKKYNLKVIEDAAQSLGSEYNGRRTASFGDAGCFSFQGAKAVVTGEGGMFLTSDEELYNKVRFYWDHGRDPKGTLSPIAIGYKYKMSNVQAAIGLAQIEKIDEIVAKKRQIFSWYRDRLQDMPELQLNAEESWARNIFWMSTIVLGDQIKLSSTEFRAKLKERMIDSRPTFAALSHSPVPEFTKSDSPNAVWIGERGINLPSGHLRTEEEIDYICSHIKDIIGKKSNSEISGWVKYREDIYKKIIDLKNDSNFKIDIFNKEKIGYLTPVTFESLNKKEDIELLMSLREYGQEWFPSQQKITFDGTKRWLENGLLNAKDRILFWVCDNSGKKCGHIGLFRFNFHGRFCELDNVIKSENAQRGIMHCAVGALIEYTFNILKINDMYLRCLSDNERAVTLYNNLNFKEIQRKPLTLVRKGEMAYWSDTILSDYQKIEKYFVTMKFQKDEQN